MMEPKAKQEKLTYWPWFVRCCGETYGPYDTESGAHEAAEKLAGAHASNVARIYRLTAEYRHVRKATQ